jgi:hypothetical protein
MTRITGTLHEDPYTLMVMSRSVLLRMRYVSGKNCKENRNTFYRGADNSLARPTSRFNGFLTVHHSVELKFTSRCISFDGEKISFDASLVIYTNSTNIPPIMIINRMSL